MKIAKVSHMDGIRDNFTIADEKDCAGVTTRQEAHPIRQLHIKRNEQTRTVQYDKKLLTY